MLSTLRPFCKMWKVYHTHMGFWMAPTTVQGVYQGDRAAVEKLTLFWGRGDSVKDFKLRNKNTDLQFRQILTLYTENVTWWEFCLWFLWMSKIITKLHCPKKEGNSSLIDPFLSPSLRFFPFSKVNPGSRPLLVPGILCWLPFRGE